MTAPREHFNSRLGFILASAGSAVGIGNLVGFPVAATKNGGGAFLLMYALMVFFVCLPVMLAEFAVGRNSQKDPLGAYQKLSNNAFGWRIAGYLSLLTPFMIAVFYTVITVWVFGYLCYSLIGKLELLADPSYFGTFINSSFVFTYLMIIISFVYLVLMSGVQKGIERISKILMPTLFIMMLGLIVFVLTLDNAVEGLKYYLIPDPSKIDSKVISGALSQAFFSLSLGMGILITYGSYMGKNANLPQSAKLVALADTGVAFMAGLLILPAIFSFNPATNTEQLSDSSVSLIFTFLPKIFLALQATVGFIGASIVSSIFFLLVFFAAMTSLVSIIEVPLAGIMDHKGYSRRKSLSILIVAITLCSAACALSFGKVDFLTSFVHYAGVNKSLFDVVIDIFYDTILPLNGFLICIFVIYRWKKVNFDKELATGDEPYHGTWLERYVNISLSTIIPVILFVIFVNTVAIKFFGLSLLG